MLTPEEARNLARLYVKRAQKKVSEITQDTLRAVDYAVYCQHNGIYHDNNAMLAEQSTRMVDAKAELRKAKNVLRQRG